MFHNLTLFNMLIKSGIFLTKSSQPGINWLCKNGGKDEAAQ